MERERQPLRLVTKELPRCTGYALLPRSPSPHSVLHSPSRLDNSLAGAYPVTLGLKKGLEAEVVLVVEVALNVGGGHSVVVHAQCL